MNQTDQPIVLGAIKKKNVVVNYLIQQMAVLMLAKTRPDDKFTRMVQDVAEKTRKRLQASHTEDELKPILIMRDAAVLMAEKLAACDDVETLDACLHYMNELTAGRVYVMEDVENPEAHGLTPNL